ncbi:MAG: 30S ribosome-binding factor RbfA [Bacteroidaceae bacterium]|nr:30S ribosome-binding factor RbfA [Bacteroidaceae bacterium]
METTRQQKIARLIQKDLSNIFQTETRQMRGVLVSVSAVRISSDLSVAKAYLSIFPSSRAEEIINNVNANASRLRYTLGTLERHQLRIIPELKFFIDDSLDYVENIDRLLKEDGITGNPAPEGNPQDEDAEDASTEEDSSDASDSTTD